VAGECSYWACIPSKTLLRPGEAVQGAREAPGAAEAVSGTIAAERVFEWRDFMVSDYDDAGQLPWLEEKGIDLLRGTGRIDGERSVVVTAADGTENRLTARHAVAVCTGSSAAVPPIDGLRDIHPWTPREATSAKEVPGRLLIIGGGVVGCELATAWR
jgi:pyruvate/2-oxoglutarate dehydrogenase complex dihydrolipoamide dehydrogenase (E3) component